MGYVPAMAFFFKLVLINLSATIQNCVGLFAALLLFYSFWNCIVAYWHWRSGIRATGRLGCCPPTKRWSYGLPKTLRPGKSIH